MPAPPSAGQRVGRILGWSLTGFLLTCLIGSIVLNIYLALFVGSLTGGPHETAYESGAGPGRIVILPIVGFIDGRSHSFVRKSLAMLRQNRPTAVILRVDSGGGLVSPSDRILGEITRFKQDTGIPVVGSFGGLAASGGYYVAAQCDWIVAETTCTTGSLGVMASAFTVERLLDKIGVTPEVAIATGSPHKDVANNVFRSWTEADRSKLRAQLDHAHDRFVDAVFEGRKAHLETRERAVELANGDIYTSMQAVELKLVDQVGYLHDAIDKATALAGLSESERPAVNVIEPAARIGLMNMLGRRSSGPAPLTGEQLRRILVELNAPRLEYR